MADKLDQPTVQEMKQALLRSGYLLEQRVESLLVSPSSEGEGGGPDIED